MFKKLTVIFLLLNTYTLHAQTAWSQEKLFEQKNFIENKGQYDLMELPNKEPILFLAKIDGVTYYFTKSGYTIGKKEQVEKSKEELEETEEQEKKSHKKEEGEERNKYKTIEFFHELLFENANPNVEVIAENKVEHYYSFTDFKSPKKVGTIIANAFKRLTYKNIYPNTDIVFEFPKDSTGIKYSIYLYKGADVEKIKFSFPYTTNAIELNNGNLELNSAFGKITDHQPLTYTAENRTFIKSNFKKITNQVGFEIENQTIDETIIIDPWTVTPNFGNSNNAYDVDYDNLGNTYVYGYVDNSTGPQLLKYNLTGVLVWSYTPFINPLGLNSAYGDFAIDRNSNNIYIVEGINFSGAQIIKTTSNATTVLANYPGDPNFVELWRIAFSKCTNQIVAAGGGTTSPTYQTCYIDTSLSNMTPVKYVPSNDGGHDVGLLALDDYGNCYQIVVTLQQPDGIFENELVKLPLPALLPITYHVSTHHPFVEAHSVAYATPLGVGGCGYNGLTTSGAFVYSYDSYLLKKWDGLTGNMLADKRINYPTFIIDTTKIYWGGISADNCGNLFLADSNLVLQYDTALTLVNSYPVAGVITDINWNKNSGILHVCGLGFASTLVPTNLISCNDLIITPTITNASCSVAGGASIVVSGGNPPYTIAWNTSPPQDGASISNVPPGTYIVTVSDSSCVTKTVNDTITISANPDTFVSTIINDSCNSKIIINTQGGTAPYSYAWSNGLPNSAAVSIPTSGNYSVTITDANGCLQTYTVTINVVAGVTATVSPYPSITINQGESIPLVAGGGGAYSWNPTTGLSCVNCPSPIASPLASTDYCVTVTAPSGCIDSACVEVEIAIKDTCGTFYIPNAFTADNNNLNEVFKPSISCAKDYRFLIFDRWGTQIFETTNIDEGWNGIYKGTLCKQDVYVYKIYFVEVKNKKPKEYYGRVTLLY